MSTTRWFFLPNQQTINKNYIHHPEKKTKWRSIGKETLIDFSFRICVDFQKKKLQEFTLVVRKERISFMWLEGMEVRRFPFCTIKKKQHAIHSVRQGVFIEYLAANEIIDQYRYA